VQLAPHAATVSHGEQIPLTQASPGLQPFLPSHATQAVPAPLQMSPEAAQFLHVAPHAVAVLQVVHTPPLHCVPTAQLVAVQRQPPLTQSGWSGGQRPQAPASIQLLVSGATSSAATMSGALAPAPSGAMTSTTPTSVSRASESVASRGVIA
jgi:hypothetical protein